jgi:hypothetical protein
MSGWFDDDLGSKGSLARLEREGRDWRLDN